ncbi:hypothetical protein Q1695_005654 [Nippostrongylus brasiliensis]|nr:hypothetical protein Q1695_005654 [Nippostrongylus brasiliensis]
MARIPSRLDVVDINELKGLLKQENTTRMLEDLKRKLLELRLKARSTKCPFLHFYNFESKIASYQLHMYPKK